MAGLVYNKSILPISTGITAPRPAGIDHEEMPHLITCGKTLDYYVRVDRKFMAIQRDASGTLRNATLWRSKCFQNLATLVQTAVSCVEYANNTYMIHEFGNDFSVESERGLATRLTTSVKPWRTSSSAECNDGKLYFATYGGSDFPVPGMDNWHALDFKATMDTGPTGFIGSHMSAGDNGQVYCICDVGKDLTLIARDPRAPRATFPLGTIGHVVGIYNVDDVLYLRLYDEHNDSRVAMVHIYDERANALIGTTAVINTKAVGVCRLEPLRMSS